MNAPIGPNGMVKRSPGKRAAYITTSWDDGNPLDQRVADLLAKYGLRGTFYIPRQAETETMKVNQIRDLSRTFEVGAHTLNHVVLPLASDSEARREIVASKAWIEDCTGLPCRMFCPPRGKYARRHLVVIRQAGYLGMRNVELLSLAFPRTRAGLPVLPTTIQAYPHRLAAYLRNSIKHGSLSGIWRFAMQRRSTEWGLLARELLPQVIELGGVFHLWGHSWEIEKQNQWHRLEEVLRYMSEFVGQAVPLTNAQVCEAVVRGPSYAGDVVPVAAIE